MPTIPGGRIEWAPGWEAEINHTSRVRQMLDRAGELVTQEAKRLAATSPDGSHGRRSGYMRSHIGWRPGADGQGPYTDVVANATTPEGHCYAADVEFGTRPHLIVSHGSYPLRDKHGNVFGRVVQHPGTEAQPFLRPALDVLRGRQL